MILDLPSPDSDARALSGRLQARIREEIDASGGRIPFARYMELALYAPGLGYYSAGARKFGRGGDFITAPEVSPLFSRCLARQCAELLERLGSGDVLEFGAGSGAMAAVILTELQAIGRLPDVYYILEVSAELRERQHETLKQCVPGLASRVRWLEQPPERGFCGLVLANEVLDALPVHLFRVADDGLQEGFVVGRKGAFVLEYGEPQDARLREQITRIEEKAGPLPAGYRSEVNLFLQPWVQTVAALLARGAALCIDYGYPRREYYHPQRGEGTLMCHYRHRAHADPFILTGLQDITAFVDFTAVAEAGLRSGLALAGYTTQAHFLMGCGLTDMAAASDPDDVQSHLERVQQIKKLTLPSEMGERFKVLGLHRNLGGGWMGFRIRDMRGAL